MSMLLLTLTQYMEELFQLLGKLLDPISQDACAFYENQAIYKDFSGVVEEVDEGDEIAKALGDKKVAILQNHGILTTGTIS